MIRFVFSGATAFGFGVGMGFVLGTVYGAALMNKTV